MGRGAESLDLGALASGLSAEPGPGVLAPWQVRGLLSLPSYGAAANKARPAWHPEPEF